VGSGALLVVYACFALGVIWKYGRYFDASALTVIIIYLVSMLIRLVFTVYDLVTMGKADPHGIAIPNAVAAMAIEAVFYYFTYELRLVQLKLECRSFSHFLTKLKQAKLILTLAITLLVTIMVLRIWADFFTYEEVNTVGSFGWDLMTASVFISIFTDEGIAFLLWFYFIYFFRKKKQFLSKTRGQFTFQEKAIISWTFIVLLSNTINFAFDNYLDVHFLFIENFDFE